MTEHVAWAVSDLRWREKNIQDHRSELSNSIALLEQRIANYRQEDAEMAARLASVQAAIAQLSGS